MLVLFWPKNCPDASVLRLPQVHQPTEPLAQSSLGGLAQSFLNPDNSRSPNKVREPTPYDKTKTDDNSFRVPCLSSLNFFDSRDEVNVADNNEESG